MSLATAETSPADLPVVEAEMRYVGPMNEKPWRLTYTPAPGEPDTNAAPDMRLTAIRDMRPVAEGMSLDGQGFALLHAPSALRAFDDDARIKAVYYPEAERLVAEATGASRVMVFDHTIRRNQPDAPRLPVTRVHNDYTDISAPQRLRDFLGAEAEDWIGRRFAIINVWRPINGPVIDIPLAVADARSLDPADVIATDLVYRDRTGEVRYFRYNANQDWYYASAMTEDEVLLLKCHDSARDGRARFTAHSAFADPTAPADAPRRESIELRTFALLD